MYHVGHVFKKESHKGKLVYVGRKSSIDRINKEIDDMSILGNKFYMHTEKDRKQVCEDYRKYMLIQLIENRAFTTAIDRIQDLHDIHGDVTLLCWCWPNQCHAEEIVNFLNHISMR